MHGLHCHFKTVDWLRWVLAEIKIVSRGLRDNVSLLHENSGMNLIILQAKFNDNNVVQLQYINNTAVMTIH